MWNSKCIKRDPTCLVISFVLTDRLSMTSLTLLSLAVSLKNTMAALSWFRFDVGLLIYRLMCRCRWWSLRWGISQCKLKIVHLGVQSSVFTVTAILMLFKVIENAEIVIALLESAVLFYDSSVSCLRSFRTKLKTHLFQCTYLPWIDFSIARLRHNSTSP